MRSKKKKFRVERLCACQSRAPLSSLSPSNPRWFSLPAEPIPEPSPLLLNQAATPLILLHLPNNLYLGCGVSGRCRGGLGFQANRRLYHSTPGPRVTKKKKKFRVQLPYAY